MQDSGPSLIEAASFIERFFGECVVVKLGGELFDRGPILDRLVPQIEVLRRCGLRCVLVHGGGSQVDQRCRSAGIAVDKVAGRRITTPQVLDVVVDVIGRQLNADICQRLLQRGIATVGFGAGVSQTIRCARRPAVVVDAELVDYGEVGDIVAIDLAQLEDLLRQARPPGAGPPIAVFPSLGTTDDGGYLNANADSVAARLAIALEAQKMIMLSRVSGVMEEPDAEGPISQLSLTQARQLLASDNVGGGMRVKLEEALRALDAGVPQVHIISGVEPQTLLREIFTKEGCGTLISADV